MTNPLVADIVVSIPLALVANTSYTVYLTTSLSVILLSLLKSVGKILPLFTSKLSYLVFKLAKSVSDASVDISMPVATCCQISFRCIIR